MVRPKASEVNKAIARIFADTVTVETTSSNDQRTWFDKSNPTVDCRGQKSIFQALVLCLPNIVREVKDQAVKNRKGVTEVELNKFLTSSGYVSSRRRLWNSDSRMQWHREWCDRRWINPQCRRDLAHVQKQLLKFQRYPEARSLTVDHIRACLHEMFEGGSLRDMLSSLPGNRKEQDSADPDSAAHVPFAWADDGSDCGINRIKGIKTASSTRTSLETPAHVASKAEPFSFDRLRPRDDVAAAATPSARLRGGRPSLPPLTTNPFELAPSPLPRPQRGCRLEPPQPPADEQAPRLLRMAEEGGWDFPELRRLLTHGYCADAVWGLLTSLPPDLRAMLRAALRAAEPAALPSVCGGGTDPDLARRIFSEMDAEMRSALEAEAAGIGAGGGVGFFEAEYDAATQRRGAVRLSERYAALFHGSTDCGRAALLTHYARHEVPLPAPELDFLAAVIDDLLRRAAGDVIQYLRVVRPPPAGEYGSNPTAFTSGGRRPSEAALVCVLSRARFDAGGRITRVRPLPTTVRLPSPGRKWES